MLDSSNAVTLEPVYVYDFQRCVVQFATATSGALSNQLYSVVAATAGQKIKVLSVVVMSAACTTAGNIELHDGATAFPIGHMSVSTAGQNISYPPTPTIIYSTGTGFSLGVFVRGAATVTTSLTYYKVPA